ncbi:MAG: hypothetical protein ACYC55_04070 [Candidatus Geothermincolia bacterium]
MCREGLDVTTIKISLRQAAERADREAGALRQWSAYTAHMGLENASRRLAEAAEHAAEASHQLQHVVEDLVGMQAHGHVHPHEHGGDVTITPM